jgi:DNA transposition AAA+ family ATPase
MKIIETKIPDVTADNLDESKQILADNIISNVYPLFNDLHKGKEKEIINYKQQLTKLRSVLKHEQDTIKQLLVRYSKAKKISKILDRVRAMIESGLTNDGSLRHETVILLKILEKLPTEKLDEQLNKTILLLNKRFAR